MGPFGWLCAGIVTGVAVGIVIEEIKESSNLSNY